MKNLAAILLVLVILASAGWLVWYYSVDSGGPPDEALKTPIVKVDEKALEVMTLTAAEWRNLGWRQRKYKNPKTGTYTMVSAVTCGNCGKKIPRPAIDTKKTPEIEPGLSWHNAQKDYICPHCGKPALPEYQDDWPSK